MIDYQQALLSKLLDWYENSPSHARGILPARRRYLHLYDDGKTDFAAYNIEDSKARQDINRAVLDLADRDFISYEWMRGQQGHIVARLWLNIVSKSPESHEVTDDLLKQVYAFCKRKPKQTTIDQIVSELHTLSGLTTEPWLRLWLHDTMDAIESKRSLGSTLPTDPVERDDLLKALGELTLSNEVETFERVFSLKCFGDSKRFASTVKPRLVRILRKYLAQDDSSDEEVLRLVGIVSYPERFEFSGKLSLKLQRSDKRIDYSLLPYGASMTIEDVWAGRITLGSVKRLLTIENLACYVDYIHRSKLPDELVIYHGGQFSPAKRVFLETVVSALPDHVKFEHWGDIDYGGFTILARLRREIFTAVKPWRMGVNELKEYTSFCSGFDRPYQQLLNTLLKIPELADCSATIKYMLEHRVRLEQEALLVSSHEACPTFLFA